MVLALASVTLLAFGCTSSPRPPAAATSKNAIAGGLSRPTREEASRCAASSAGVWMHCLVLAHPAFDRVPLSAMALPGSENAGTFNLDPEAADTQVGSQCTTLDPSNTENGATTLRFSATQDMSLTQQLDEGIRWINLTVGYNGSGNALAGWRVVQNLYSSWPLFEYLDQVANWAAEHPTEVVVVDISSICDDHRPTQQVDRGLWANFAEKSAEGAGPETISNVARPTSHRVPLASATLGDLAEPGHNVAVLVPHDARDWQDLVRLYGVQPYLAAPPGPSSTRKSAMASTVVARSDPRVAPTSVDQFPLANIGLAAYAKHAEPPLGSLKGKGFSVSDLLYELQGAPATAQHAILQSFVGLIDSQGIDPAWSYGLWGGAYARILESWGDSENVVLANGIEYGEFVPQLIEANAARSRN